jgi:hypothetical protein
VADYVHDAQVDPNPPHKTCLETTGPAELVAGIRSWTCSPDCPAPGAEAYGELARLRAAADPDRDARREAYRETERRKAARALDRYLEAHEHAVQGTGPIALLSAAGERFVEAVGDYVLSRLQQKSHYGVPEIQDAAESVLGPSAGRDVVEALRDDPPGINFHQGGV